MFDRVPLKEGILIEVGIVNWLAGLVMVTVWSPNYELSWFN